MRPVEGPAYQGAAVAWWCGTCGTAHANPACGQCRQCGAERWPIAPAPGAGPPPQGVWGRQQ
eukprot:960301-Alexandrium_andersonii.AAC.1